MSHEGPTMPGETHSSGLLDRVEKPGPWMGCDAPGVRRYRFTCVTKFEPNPWVVDIDTGGTHAVRLQRWEQPENTKVPFGFHSPEKAQEAFSFWLNTRHSKAVDRGN